MEFLSGSTFVMVSKLDFFEDILKNELLRRQSINSSYSLRAYAKSLGIQASPLSAILKGKRPITNQMKIRLGSVLGLSIKQINSIPTMREYESREILVEFEQIDKDKFDLLSSSYNFAVLELFELVDYKSSLSWMAEKLGIAEELIEDSLKRLHRLGYLKKTGKKYSLVNNNNFTTSLTPGLTDVFRKRYQKEIINCSLHAIDNIDISKRDHSSVTIAINENDLEEARALTKKYRTDMVKLLNKKSQKTAVYHLQIGFFPITK